MYRLLPDKIAFIVANFFIELSLLIIELSLLSFFNLLFFLLIVVEEFLFLLIEVIDVSL